MCFFDSSQGAPGNRGFPGQDGLAGAKVGPDWLPVMVQSHLMTPRHIQWGFFSSAGRSW